jgi:Flp pilus assembly protein TadB
LQQTAEQFEGRGVFGARLNRHVEARLAESPDAVLRGLAQDFNSQYLEDMVRHIEISRQAGARLSDALILTVENIEEDIRSSVSFDIRKASNQLTAPMIIGIFMPIVILAVLPLIVDFLQRLR